MLNVGIIKQTSDQVNTVRATVILTSDVILPNPALQFSDPSVCNLIYGTLEVDQSYVFSQIILVGIANANRVWEYSIAVKLSKLGTRLDLVQGPPGPRGPLGPVGPKGEKGDGASIVFSGDLSGDNTIQTVVGLQGNAVSSSTPADKQVMTWNQSAAQWEPDDATGGVNRYVYSLVDGENSTLYGSTSPLVVGAAYFDANGINPVSGGMTRHVLFKAIIETSDTGHAVNIDVYDVNGITNGGTPTPIAASAISDTSEDPKYVSASLDAVLGTVTTYGIMECRLWISSPDGTNVASCKMAKLEVWWT